MPELPDVEELRRYMDKTTLGHTIGRVSVNAKRMLDGITENALQRRLRGHRFERTHRHGKYLFAGLDDAHWLVLHFGMAGELKLSEPDQTPPPASMLIGFADGAALAFDVPRKIGKIAYTDDPAAFVQQHKLGPDALALQRRQFQKLAEGRSGNVKAWLMDQESLAGIGNVYSDEILFQAGILPTRAVSSLDTSDIDRLFGAMREVLKTTIGAHADPARMPSSYLIPHRRKGKACPRCGGKVESATVAGRTSYYCRRCQQ